MYIYVLYPLFESGIKRSLYTIVLSMIIEVDI